MPDLTSVCGYAADRIGISRRGGVAIPGGDGALLEVDTKSAGDAGVASDRWIEPDRDGPPFILDILLAHRCAERKVHLIFRHAAQDVPLINRPAHAFGIGGVLLHHQALALAVAAGQNEGEEH